MSGLRVVVFGATGTAGSALVRACLADARVERVTAVVRRPPGLEAPRLRPVLCADFLDLAPLAAALAETDCCFFCLGVAQSQERDAARYARITRDYPLAAARQLLGTTPGHAFHFLSGQGADPSGRSRVRFARIKGEAEAALAACGLRALHVWRPGYIHPRDRRRAPHLGYRLVGALFPLLRHLRSFALTDAQLAQGMLQAAVTQAPPAVRENREILALAAAYAAGADAA